MSDLDLPCLSLDSPRWDELTHAYGSAAATSGRAWDDDFVAFALAALAAAKGSFSVAAAALELTPDVAEDVLTWLEER